jgi:hypothetical protein
VRFRFAAILAATLLAFAGCFFAPDRPGGQSGPGDADPDGTGTKNDGAEDDSRPSANCPSDDMADMAMVCGTWGMTALSGDGMVSRSSGSLQTKVATTGSHAECVTTERVDFTHGASIDLQQPLATGSGDTTQFVASFDGGGTVTIQAQVISAVGLRISAVCSGPGGFETPAPYDSTYRYLKIAVQTPGTSTVAAFRSADGETWNSMGSCSLTGNDVTLATISFGVTAGSPGTLRAATFDDFTTCTTTP